MEKVQVLLSTYNGEKYIQEQLDSIFNQKKVEVHCLIRDDGSNDNTISILTDYQQKYKNIEIIKGTNIGYGPSFMKLLEHSGNFDFYAFSDQDDIWENNKLISAIELLNKTEQTIPSLYFSNLTTINDNLEKTGMLHTKSQLIPTNNLTCMFQGFAHGCTMVINESTKQLILKYKPIQKYAHDFWIPLLVVFFGHLIYDKNSYIQYRQHRDNVFGQKRSIWQLIKNRFAFINEEKNYYSIMAQDLIKGYSSLLKPEFLHEILKIAEYKKSILNRLSLLFNKKIRRNTLRGTILLKILILFSKF